MDFSMYTDEFKAGAEQIWSGMKVIGKAVVELVKDLYHTYVKKDAVESDDHDSYDGEYDDLDEQADEQADEPSESTTLVAVEPESSSETEYGLVPETESLSDLEPEDVVTPDKTPSPLPFKKADSDVLSNLDKSAPASPALERARKRRMGEQ